MSELKTGEGGQHPQVWGVCTSALIIKVKTCRDISTRPQKEGSSGTVRMRTGPASDGRESYVNLSNTVSFLRQCLPTQSPPLCILQLQVAQSMVSLGQFEGLHSKGGKI